MKYPHCYFLPECRLSTPSTDWLHIVRNISRAGDIQKTLDILWSLETFQHDFSIEQAFPGDIHKTIECTLEYLVHGNRTYILNKGYSAPTLWPTKARAACLHVSITLRIVRACGEYTWFWVCFPCASLQLYIMTFNIKKYVKIFIIFQWYY